MPSEVQQTTIFLDMGVGTVSFGFFPRWSLWSGGGGGAGAPGLSGTPPQAHTPPVSGVHATNKGTRHAHTRPTERWGAEGVDGWYNARRCGALGPHAHRNAVRRVVDDRRVAEVCGQQKPSSDPRNNQHSPNTPTTGLRERGNDTSGSTGRSGRQNAATRRNMRREERVTVQGPVKEQQPDGLSHGGGGGLWALG